MTSLLEGAKRLVTRGSDLGDRLAALNEAADAARGRLDDDILDQARDLVDRASSRLRLSADHTVVAIAGATGSGKSSTFNALTGLELSAVGVRRPTTSWATACVWGQEGAVELLEWLGIPPRHQSTRESMLDARGRASGDLDGVVLLDLPDHDSTEVAHHLEVDRIVRLADLLVWVLDPQKYADAAVHDRYLAPLATHAGVMLVVLNHIDEVPADRRGAMIDDVARLLDADGLREVPVIATSARFGDGIPDLRAEIARRVAAKMATRQRLEADLQVVARRMSAACGTDPADRPGRPGRADRARRPAPERVEAMQDALADAAGVPTVVDAVARSTRTRARRATGWPVVSWLSRLRPDPLKRLHLDLDAQGRRLTAKARTSVPVATPVQRARVDHEVRALAEDVGADLARPWAEAVRRASVSHLPELSDRLDRSVGATDLGVRHVPAWAGLVRVLQWLLVLAALVGAVWTLALVVSGSTGVGAVPRVLGVDLPLLLLVGGVAVGVVLALVCRLLVELTVRRRASAANRGLRSGIDEVAHELVVAPIEVEMDALRTVREGLARALR